MDKQKWGHLFMISWYTRNCPALALYSHSLSLQQEIKYIAVTTVTVFICLQQTEIQPVAYMQDLELPWKMLVVMSGHKEGLGRWWDKKKKNKEYISDSAYDIWIIWENAWILNNGICWRRKATTFQNTAMTLQSDTDAVNKYAIL